MNESEIKRYDAEELLEFGAALFAAAGLSASRARDVSEVLLEGDLLGHTTHGFALLGLYLKELKEGGMTIEGEPRVVADHGSAVTWDADYLPGPWVIREAIAAAKKRLSDHPLVTIAIGRCHHIACLQAFLKPVTDENLMVVLMCTDPCNRWVAPFGAVQPVFSPNPLAVGIPTSGEPVLIDISMSTTAAGQCVRAAKAGKKLPGKWLVGADGQPSDDPAPLVNKQEGALYTLGGSDLGYKGFGLTLMLEAMTSGLAGHGRADGNALWGCSALLQLIDPEKFGGRAAFLRETSFLGDACRAAKVANGKPPVRLPGQGALARRAEQIKNGVKLRPEIKTSLEDWARDLGVPVPAARS